MVRIGVPSAIAFNAGTAVSTGSTTTVVFAHVSGGFRVLENTILGSSAIRGKVVGWMVLALVGLLAAGRAR